MTPTISADLVRVALLALEGSTIDDFRLPLPGNIKDISKAAALVSGVVEDRIPALLNQVRDRTWDEDGLFHAYEFRRFTIGFPDILLIERANPANVLFELEAKSWYILSGDPLTARFETSGQVVREGTLVAVVAWLLDGIVSGSPKLLRIHIDDAKRLAAVRDAAWTSIGSTTHRVVEPENQPETARNLIRTQVRGELLSSGSWRKDSDNFGKLDRLYDEDLQRFRDDVWSLTAGGKTLGQWRSFGRT